MLRYKIEDIYVRFILAIYSGNWVKVTSIAISILYDNTGTNWLECVLVALLEQLISIVIN